MLCKLIYLLKKDVFYYKTLQLLWIFILRKMNISFFESNELLLNFNDLMLKVIAWEICYFFRFYYVKETKRTFLFIHLELLTINNLPRYCYVYMKDFFSHTEMKSINEIVHNHIVDHFRLFQDLWQFWFVHCAGYFLGSQNHV